MKYAALILNALGMLIFGFAISMLTRPGILLPVRTLKADVTPATQNDDARQLASARQTLFSMEKLKPALVSLAAGTKAPLIAQTSVASVRAEPSSASQADSNGNTASILPAQRRLTLMIDGTEGRRAVIDGRLVRSGDLLPDGSKVVSLLEDHAVLAQKKQRQVLTLPLAQLRVGTLSRRSEVTGTGSASSSAIVPEKTTASTASTKDSTDSVASAITPETLQNMKDIAAQMREASRSLSSPGARP